VVGGKAGTQDPCRDPRADPRDGSREFSLVRTAYSRRTAETRNRRLESRYMPASHGGRRSQTWRTFVRNQATVIVCSRTIEGYGWINSIGSWLRAVRHGAPRFAAAALTAPRSWRPRYLAYTRGLIATHRRVRITRDVALTVASIATIGRRLTPTKRKIDPLAAGRTRGPPRCARAQSASNRRHGNNGIRFSCFAGGHSRQVPRSSAMCRRHTCEILGHRIANRDQPMSDHNLRAAACRHEYTARVLRNDSVSRCHSHTRGTS
jgi:hypothetical protein